MYIGLCAILDLARQGIRVVTEGPFQTAYFAGDCGNLKKIVFSSESLFTNVNSFKCSRVVGVNVCKSPSVFPGFPEIST